MSFIHKYRESTFNSDNATKHFLLHCLESIIIAVVLCGCATWCVAIREGQRLWVSEKRVLLEMFIFKREDVTGERRRIHENNIHKTLGPSRVNNLRRLR